MELLSQYTGLKTFTLLGGSPPADGDEKGEYLLSVVSFGKTSEPAARTFTQFKPDLFKNNVFPEFASFLEATKREHTGFCARAQTAHLA